MIYYYDAYGNVTTAIDVMRTTEIEPPSNCPAGQQPNWTGGGWACIAFSAPAVAPVQTLGTQITPLALTKRIGVTAMTAIYSAAPTTPSLQVWIAQTWGARYIDLTDPLLAVGLNALAAANILTATQVTTILTSPVLQVELP